MPHRFTLDQVAQRLQAVYPEDTAELNRTYLSGELWRLKERGEIVVHKAGAGRRPAIYKKGTDSEE